MRLATLKPKISTLRTGPATLPASPAGAWRAGKTSTQRGYDSKWQKARIGFLEKHALCECQDCMAGLKRVTAATVVNHRIPHRGDMALFWDRSNWEAMSKTCHDKRTQDELKPGWMPPPRPADWRLYGADDDHSATQSIA